ncbi:phosphoesterase family protein [bacterium BMS3Abin05]|nr:phosphoesterase family protein [bacterium BMS3Abin05]GBE26819.1 phosphoesterase family protein [bacterium BMS3Bbin03]
MKRFSIFKQAKFVLAVFAIALLASCAKRPLMMLPGKTETGATLLPNRYQLTPAGRQIPVGDLPLNMVVSPDGKYLAVTNNGYGAQFVSIIDVAAQKQVQTLPVRASFFGIDFSADGGKLFVSGGGRNRIYIFTRQKSKFVRLDSINLTPDLRKEWFVMGLKSARNGKILYVATKTVKKLLKVSVPDKKILKALDFNSFLYDVVLTPSGKKLYASLWGGSAVAVVDPETLTLLKRIPVGDHPNKMALSSDGRLFVANANTDNVSVIDTKTDSVIETISLKPYKNAPNGTAPNGLSITQDAKTLYVANADNNDVAVVDISRPGRSHILGLIPAGWYPTAVALSKDGRELFIANGKGVRSKANPKGPNPTRRHYRSRQYIARLLWGTVSILPVPGPTELKRYTEQVRINNGWTKTVNNRNQAASVQPHAIPRKAGEPSPIKHVVYIIKENRTYDQVLGDLPQGNGDSRLVLFGRKITPNHHKLAENFVLFDNFYVDAEVSADGHEWSTGAITTDFVEKTWPTTYSGRGRGYPSGQYYKIAYPTIGYIWDMAAEKGISYRSYAEFIDTPPDTSEPAYTTVKTLKGHFDPKFRPWDLNYMDIWRAKEFIRELHEYEKTDNWPNLIIMRLPNDHNYGTRPGKHTPRSMTADNDLALGMVVDAISHSKYWKETAIFVLEDDAQNGPDHVDAHRSVLLVASPYTRRGFVDHNMYDTVSVLKTIELILGLPHMSQYDAAAFPLIPAFQDKPDFAPYTLLKNEWPLNKINSRTAYGAKLSMMMNFGEEDEAPEQELNEILWKSIKGIHSKMPEIKNGRYRQLFH